jgi:hypothetical protein
MFDTYSDVTFIAIALKNSELVGLAMGSIAVLILSNVFKGYVAINYMARNAHVDGKYIIMPILTSFDYFTIVDMDV